MNLYPQLQKVLAQAEQSLITEKRKEKLEPLISYLREKKQTGKSTRLNFICTHNSRRSQLAQLWAQVIAYQYNFSLESFSGGTEISALHPNVVQALKETGFVLTQTEKVSDNPIYHVSYTTEERELVLFSKLYSNPSNPVEGFAAVMTCSEAAENCPFVRGAEQRIALPYEDPKVFDGSKDCISKYKESSFQIASELSYAFRKALSLQQ